MAVSIASNIDEKSINFDNSNMLDKGSWVVTKGKATFGDVITLGVGAEVKLVLNYTRNNNVVGQYIKMVCNASSTDKSLSTVEAHNLSMNLILKQVDNDYKNYYSVYTFYPTYDHETHFKDNYTVSDISTDEIISIEIKLTNNENVEVQLSNLGLFISIIMNEKNVQEIIEKYLYENVNLIIPLLEERPEDNDDSIRDGAIFRVPAW